MDDPKERIRKAVEKYTVKNDPARIKRKNRSPERDLQLEVIRWMNANGFDVTNVDSAAAYSLTAGSYISSQHAAPGLPDIIGNDSQGRAVYVELKAPGRRASLRANQREFLVRKIKTNCFAIVADSIEYIQRTYEIWIAVLNDNGPYFLLEELPKEKPIKDDPLF